MQFETIKARDRALQLSKQTLLNKQVMVNKSRFGIKPIAPENVGTAGQTDGQQIEAAQRHSASSVEASAPVDVHPVATAPDAPTSAAPTPVHATKPPPPSKERMAMFKPRSMRTKLQL